MQVGDLVVEVVHSICQIEPLAARQTLKAPIFRLCCDNVGLRNRQRSLLDLVKLHEYGTLPHPIVVVHQHTHDLTWHTRRDKGRGAENAERGPGVYRAQRRKS